MKSRFRLPASLLLLGIFLFQGKAQALPLLSDQAGINVKNLLTAYPDSEDPNLVYYMPNSSEMSRDASGIPQFGFTYWGLHQADLSKAGAYLTFSLRLSSNEEQTTALNSLLQEGKRISLLPVEASTIGLNTTQSGQQALGKLFEEFNFAQKGGPTDAEIGVNASLTGLGAKVFKAAIDTPQLMKADYCYKVQGLGPQFHGWAEVNFSQVYNALQARASAGGWWFRAQVSAEVEKLRKEGAIQLHFDGGTATEREYVQKLTDTVVQKFFTAELKAEPGQAPADGEWSFSRLSIHAVHKEELQTGRVDFFSRDLVEREFCSNLAIKDIAPFKNRVVKDADASLERL